VERLYAVTNDRWSVVIRKRQHAGEKSSGMRLEVGIFRECQYFTSYIVTSEAEDGSAITLGPVRSHAGLLACGLPKREAESVRQLIHTANDLCGYLLRGRSITRWCKDKGLWPVSAEAKTATGGKGVRIIDMQGQVVVW
jgi:hypothetical protein